METDTHCGTSTETVTETEVNVAYPKKYKVILHNDDKTTFDFVITLLMSVFHKTAQEATNITLAVHEMGYGVAGVYSKEIAEEKTEESTALAQSMGFPLMITCEEH